MAVIRTCLPQVEASTQDLSPSDSVMFSQDFEQGIPPFEEFDIQMPISGIESPFLSSTAATAADDDDGVALVRSMSPSSVAPTDEQIVNELDQLFSESPVDLDQFKTSPIEDILVELLMAEITSGPLPQIIIPEPFDWQNLSIIAPPDSYDGDGAQKKPEQQQQQSLQPVFEAEPMLNETPKSLVKQKAKPRQKRSSLDQAREEKSFKCEECDKVYKDKRNYQNHVNHHLGVSGYRCGFIGCSGLHSIMPSAVERHVRKNHDNSDNFAQYVVRVPITEGTIKRRGGSRKSRIQSQPADAQPDKVC